MEQDEKDQSSSLPVPKGADEGKRMKPSQAPARSSYNSGKAWGSIKPNLPSKPSGQNVGW